MAKVPEAAGLFFVFLATKPELGLKPSKLEMEPKAKVIIEIVGCDPAAIGAVILRSVC